MHQMTSAICAATPVGSSIDLTDARESGRTYSVRKLKDGRCWMTGPLVISAAQTLKPDTSDVPYDINWNPGTDCNSSTSPCIRWTTNLPTWVTWLYNYPAATAGQNPSSGDATRSICPKGWKLPSTTEFQTLYNNYPSYAAMTNTGGPQFYPYGIYWGGGTWTGLNERGLYWSSQAYGADDHAFFLDIERNGGSSPTVTPVSRWYRGINISIKCVAR